MTREDLLRGMQAIQEAHGPWTSHNVSLPYGVNTIGPSPNGDNYRSRKFLQLTEDALRRDLKGLRVLDLGCLEGLYAIDFAKRGADVVAVEGREGNLAKAVFACEALGITSVRFELADVRSVTAQTHGRFDCVLCSGLLYHLDQSSVFDFVEQLRRLCRGCCIIDTRIALKAGTTVTFKGRPFQGLTQQEHPAGASQATKKQRLWASLNNEQSFWFARHSLVNLLADVGFSSVLECHYPLPYKLMDDRITLLAIAGQPISFPDEEGSLSPESLRYPID